MTFQDQVLTEVSKAVVGKEDILRRTLQVILTGGHVLLEDMPGVGKTTLALAFSRALGLRWGRVQFTPDVMPSDVVGYSLYNKQTGQMDYQPGAVLCNLFLADELNRATSRTQSALLEAMEEGQVTVDGLTHPVPQPFFVIATQNPAGAAGTQPLPDSQMDRFTVKLSMGYPDAAAEAQMVRDRRGINPLDSIQSVLTAPELTALRQQTAQVHLSEPILQYIIALVNATRAHKLLQRGASPRCTLAVAAMAKAHAVLEGRDYVLPHDVADSFPITAAHRLLLTPEAEAGGSKTLAIASAILRGVPQPAIG